MALWTIYKHTSPEGKSYIGRTSQTIEKRSGKNGNKYKANKEFYADIERFGWDSFSHETLRTCGTEAESMDLEIEYIKRFDSANPDHGYNKSVGGYPCNMGLSEEEKRKRKSDGIKRWNASHREQYLAYHRKYDRSEKRHMQANARNKRPDVRKHRTEYMRKYRAEHADKVREINKRSRERRKAINAKNDSDRYSSEDGAKAPFSEGTMVC